MVVGLICKTSSILSENDLWPLVTFLDLWQKKIVIDFLLFLVKTHVITKYMHVAPSPPNRFLNTKANHIKVPMNVFLIYEI